MAFPVISGVSFAALGQLSCLRGVAGVSTCQLFKKWKGAHVSNDFGTLDGH